MMPPPCCNAKFTVPAEGTPEVLQRDNVVALEYDTDGAIAIFGLAHMSFDYGSALKITRNADGTFNQTEVAIFPSEPTAITRLKDGKFAVLTSDRVVIFSSKDGILGTASCASR